jgi:hypothetical protein
MIETPTEVHGVASAVEYRALLEYAMNEKRTHGFPVSAVFEDATDLLAYITAGRWAVDCPTILPSGDVCGATNSAHPTWLLACCFSCGACRVNLIFPANRVDIEAALNLRPLPMNRNWRTPETLAMLLADNTAHGL